MNENNRASKTEICWEIWRTLNNISRDQGNMQQNFREQGNLTRVNLREYLNLFLGNKGSSNIFQGTREHAPPWEALRDSYHAQKPRMKNYKSTSCSKLYLNPLQRIFENTKMLLQFLKQHGARILAIQYESRVAKSHLNDPLPFIRLLRRLDHIRDRTYASRFILTLNRSKATGNQFVHQTTFASKRW